MCHGRGGFRNLHGASARYLESAGGCRRRRHAPALSQWPGSQRFGSQVGHEHGCEMDEGTRKPPRKGAKGRGRVCFCTLALGNEYCLLAKQLAEDIGKSSPYPLLILTDKPSHYRDLTNTIVLRHHKRSVLGYNDKLCVVEQALSRFDTCIFIDADVRILGPIALDKEVFEPGIRAYRVRSWEYTKNEASLGQPAPWKAGNLRIMRLLRRELDLESKDEDIPYVVEFLFAITRDARTEPFLERWAHLAEFCEKNGFFNHEGFSIGLAALLVGCPVLQSSFAGVRFFEVKISFQDHVPAGLMSHDEYRTLRSSIVDLKTSGSRSRRKTEMLQRLRVFLRHQRIRLFGLRLAAA